MPAALAKMASRRRHFARRSRPPVGIAVAAALLTLNGCPETTPDSGQFAATDGVGQEFGSPGGSDSTADPSETANDTSNGADDTVADGAASDGIGSDSSDGKAGDSDQGDSDSSATDGKGDTAVDSTCGCVSNDACAGIALAACQVAVCSSCKCLVEVAPEGSACGGNNTCQKGQCLPKPAAGPWATAVVAGGHHSCARHPDGSASCWGSGSSGQLGNGGNSSAVKIPKLVSGLLVIDQLSAGNAHTCARHSGGKVSCWGDKFNGQIGSGSKDGDALVPEAAGSFADALTIATGTYGSFAIRKGATLWGWGKNNDGQFLSGDLLSQPAPVQVAPILNAQKACAGENFVCALLGDGKVWCWGRNTDGQLGHGTASYDSVPQPAGMVNGLPSVQGIACGHQHVCAWDAAGKAWCWGKNMSGQIGTGNYSTSPINAAVQLDTTGVAQIACGQGQTCAVRNNGELLCWGDNDEGQAGSSKAGNVYQPNLIALGGKASAVAVGIDHGCALRQDGAVLCWGKGTNGELGDGLATSSSQAVIVVGSAKL